MTTTLSRRNLLVSSGVAAAGLVLGFHIAPRTALAAPPPAKKPPPAPNAFLRVAPDESVTVLLAHSEMGQGIWTGLAMVIAEELGCAWSKVRSEHAPAAPTYAHPAFGIQMTGGSSTTWAEFERYRTVGAMAREMLVRAVATKWNVAPATCKVSEGVVTSGTQRATFGELSTIAMALTPPASVKLKEPSEWTIIGKPMRRLDSPEKITGRAQFGMDVQFAGLRTALVARPPAFGAKVVSFDGSGALKVPGVEKVVRTTNGVAVVAAHYWAAKLGRDALQDDVRGGFYRPAFVHRVEIGVDDQGTPISWNHTVVGQSILANTPFAGMVKNGIDNASVEGVVESPYLEGVGARRVSLHSPELPVTVLWWRSVGNTHTAFAMESAIDELAAAAKKDALAYRLALLENKPRHAAALKLAAEKAGWSKPLAAGHALGLAVHESFGSRRDARHREGHEARDEGGGARRLRDRALGAPASPLPELSPRRRGAAPGRRRAPSPPERAARSGGQGHAGRGVQHVPWPGQPAGQLRPAHPAGRRDGLAHAEARREARVRRRRARGALRPRA